MIVDTNNTQKSKKNKKTNIRTVITVVLLGALILFYFNYLNNKAGDSNNFNQEEIDKLLNYDMEANYPKTPRDVAKLHCRYTKIFYGKGDVSDDSIEKLVQKVRSIYCLEMILANPLETHNSSIKADIEDYHKQKISITNYELPEASQVQYFTKDGSEYATLEVEYTIETKDERGYYYQSYIMIKENDQWKIYGWTKSNME